MTYLVKPWPNHGADVVRGSKSYRAGARADRRTQMVHLSFECRSDHRTTYFFTTPEEARYFANDILNAVDNLENKK